MFHAVLRYIAITRSASIQLSETQSSQLLLPNWVWPLVLHASHAGWTDQVTIDVAVLESQGAALEISNGASLTRIVPGELDAKHSFTFTPSSSDEIWIRFRPTSINAASVNSSGICSDNLQFTDIQGVSDPSALFLWLVVLVSPIYN